MQHAVILAGGAGTRLWPLSRSTRPKQLLRLFNGKSLLRLSFERVAGIFDPDRIHVITGESMGQAVAAELPELPAGNLVLEPIGRDTANAIGLAAYLIDQRDPDAVMAVFTADHLIDPFEPFAAAVHRALTWAQDQPEALGTFGIKPTEPHTGFGYVQMGDSLSDGVHRVAAFREKPDRATAEQFLADGNYLWNSGMFVWQVRALLAELTRSLPENDALLASIAADWTALKGSSAAADRFGALPRISIDYGVMEKAREVFVVPLDCTWIDVGSHTAIARARDKHASSAPSETDNCLSLDGANNTLISESDHLLVTIGLDNLLVVQTPDATLVCRKEDAQRVREAVDKLRASGREDLL